MAVVQDAELLLSTSVKMNKLAIDNGCFLILSQQNSRVFGVCHQLLLDDLGLHEPPNGNYTCDKWTLIEKLSFSMIQEPLIKEALT